MPLALAKDALATHRRRSPYAIIAPLMCACISKAEIFGVIYIIITCRRSLVLAISAA
jgi:hypothetical protein